MVATERPTLVSPARPAGAPALAFAGVTKEYAATTILSGVDLAVATGAFTVIYGPPASGKSVLMRLLMGLEDPSAGRITLRGQDVTALPAASRNIGYVPQSFALYPHLSVHDNIAYPLTLARVPDREGEPIVRHAAEMLRISDLLQKRPDQLSGGQKQRVAIARGLAKQTDIFVFDDPLAGLDFKLREQLVEDLRDLQQEWRAAFLYTTSDAIEALTLADQLAVLDGGRVIEHGPPARLYADPRHQRSMALVGFPPANFLPGRLERRGGALWCHTPLFTFPTDLPPDGGIGDAATVGFRPEAIIFDGPADDGPLDEGQRPSLRFAGRIALREDLGGEEIVYLEADGASVTGVTRHHDRRDEGDGQVAAAIRPEDLLLFLPDSGERIGGGLASEAAAPVAAASNGRSAG